MRPVVTPTEMGYSIGRRSRRARPKRCSSSGPAPGRVAGPPVARWGLRAPGRDRVRQGQQRGRRARRRGVLGEWGVRVTELDMVGGIDRDAAERGSRGPNFSSTRCRYRVPRRFGGRRRVAGRSRYACAQGARRRHPIGSRRTHRRCPRRHGPRRCDGHVRVFETGPALRTGPLVRGRGRGRRHRYLSTAGRRRRELVGHHREDALAGARVAGGRRAKWKAAVLVVGGSAGMIGAPALTARAALRAGSGMVVAAVPGPDARARVGGGEVVAHAMPATESGALGAAAATELRGDFVARFKALALGPGIGTRRRPVRSSRGWSASAALPIVIDADALTLLAADPSPFGLRAGAQLPVAMSLPMTASIRGSPGTRSATIGLPPRRSWLRGCRSSCSSRGRPRWSSIRRAAWRSIPPGVLRWRPRAPATCSLASSRRSSPAARPRSRRLRLRRGSTVGRRSRRARRPG